MGRSRRRHRREALGKFGRALFAVDGTGAEHAHGETVDEPEALEPVYVSVGEAAWHAASDSPVLALEGLQDWEEIASPSIALHEDAATPDERLAGDSTDPAQLDLVGAGRAESPAGEVAAPEPAADAAALVALAVSGTVGGGPAEELPPPEPAGPDPRDVAAAQAVAVAGERSARGDQAGALAILDRAVDADPEHPLLLVERGGLLGHMGRYAAAERDLKRVLRVDPAHPQALFSLGVVMTKKGLWSEAVPLLRRAVELEPERGSAHFYLGEALNHVDDLAGALAAYQTAAELMPGHPRSLYGMGIVYDRLGRPDDAAKMYRRSRETGRR